MLKFMKVVRMITNIIYQGNIALKLFLIFVSDLIILDYKYTCFKIILGFKNHVLIYLPIFMQNFSYLLNKHLNPY